MATNHKMRVQLLLRSDTYRRNMRAIPEFKDKFLAIVWFLERGIFPPPKEILDKFDEFEGLVRLEETLN